MFGRKKKTTKPVVIKEESKQLEKDRKAERYNQLVGKKKEEVKNDKA